MCERASEGENELIHRYKNALSLDINFNTQHYHMPVSPVVAIVKKTLHKFALNFWELPLESALHKQVFVEMKVGNIITHRE